MKYSNLKGRPPGRFFLSPHLYIEVLTQIFLPYFEGTPSEGEMGIVNKMFCAR
jgi:hypothetical protein